MSTTRKLGFLLNKPTKHHYSAVFRSVRKCKKIFGNFCTILKVEGSSALPIRILDRLIFAIFDAPSAALSVTVLIRESIMDMGHSMMKFKLELKYIRIGSILLSDDPLQISNSILT